MDHLERAKVREAKEAKITKLAYIALGLMTSFVILIGIGFHDHNNDKDTLASDAYESLRYLSRFGITK